MCLISLLLLITRRCHFDDITPIRCLDETGRTSVVSPRVIIEVLKKVEVSSPVGLLCSVKETTTKCDTEGRMP